MSSEDQDISVLVEALADGSDEARDRLFRRVYSELRALARHKIAALSPHASLESRSLVHEAYLELFGRDEPRYENRAHFFGILARAMHDLIADHVRRGRAIKRGGDRRRVDLDDAELATVTRPPADELLAITDALARLREISPLSADVVKMRYYGGLNHAETAEALGVSVARVRREWAYARAFLYRRLKLF